MEDEFQSADDSAEEEFKFTDFTVVTDLERLAKALEVSIRNMRVSFTSLQEDFSHRSIVEFQGNLVSVMHIFARKSSDYLEEDEEDSFSDLFGVYHLLLLSLHDDFLSTNIVLSAGMLACDSMGLDCSILVQSVDGLISGLKKESHLLGHSSFKRFSSSVEIFPEPRLLYISGLLDHFLTWSCIDRKSVSLVSGCVQLRYESSVLSCGRKLSLSCLWKDSQISRLIENSEISEYDPSGTHFWQAKLLNSQEKFEALEVRGLCNFAKLIIKTRMDQGKPGNFLSNLLGPGNEIICEIVEDCFNATDSLDAEKLRSEIVRKFLVKGVSSTQAFSFLVFSHLVCQRLRSSPESISLAWKTYLRFLRSKFESKNISLVSNSNPKIDLDQCLIAQKLSLMHWWIGNNLEISSPPPMTEDLMKSTELILQAINDPRERMEFFAPSLKGDMAVFKSKNRSASLSDFLRIFSPRDVNQDGTLSTRFTSTTHWQKIWEETSAKDAGSAHPRFNADLEIEKALDFLENFDVMTELLPQIFCCESTFLVESFLKNRAYRSNSYVSNFVDKKLESLVTCFRPPPGSFTVSPRHVFLPPDEELKKILCILTDIEEIIFVANELLDHQIDSEIVNKILSGGEIQGPNERDVIERLFFGIGHRMIRSSPWKVEPVSKKAIFSFSLESKENFRMYCSVRGVNLQLALAHSS